MQALHRRLNLPVLLVACLIAVVSCGRDVSSKNESSRIVVPADLIESGALFRVRGPVEFYWGRLIPPDEFKRPDPPQPTAVLLGFQPWNGLVADGRRVGALGWATYRLRLSGLPVGVRLGIAMPHQLSASRLFVDGQEIAGAGTFGQAPAETVGIRHDLSGFFVARGSEADLVLHIANRDMFRGGTRGTLVLGAEDLLRSYQNRRFFLDILVLGVVLGSAVYHLSLFLLNRSETSFLVFATLCLVLALRIPVSFSKSYFLIVGPLSLESHIRLLAIANVACIFLGGLFMRSLFPKRVPWKMVAVYGVSGAGTLLLQLGDLRVLSGGQFLYIVLMLPFLGIHGLIVLYGAFRDGQASVLMAIGLVALAGLGVLAFLLNDRGAEGGAYGLLAVSVFVLFQSIALSRFFLSAMKAREQLAGQLQESHKALTSQREDLQSTLHDSLGGALTDLKLFTEQQKQLPPEEARAALGGVEDRIAETIRTFRAQLLLMEDLELTAQELLPGIHMTLLRRYSDAGREIDFAVTEEAAEIMGAGQNGSGFVGRHMDLFFLVIEMCTNDLKYGRGESNWRIGLADGNFLQILQRNRTQTAPVDSAPPPARAAERARKMNGTLRADLRAGEYSVDVRLPLRYG